jgi:hypothetical protein
VPACGVVAAAGIEAEVQRRRSRPDSTERRAGGAVKESNQPPRLHAGASRESLRRLRVRARRLFEQGADFAEKTGGDQPYAALRPFARAGSPGTVFFGIHVSANQRIRPSEFATAATSSGGTAESFSTVTSFKELERCGDCLRASRRLNERWHVVCI